MKIGILFTVICVLLCTLLYYVVMPMWLTYIVSFIIVPMLGIAIYNFVNFILKKVK